jgi:hypothetical protein
LEFLEYIDYKCVLQGDTLYTDNTKVRVRGWMDLSINITISSVFYGIAMTGPQAQLARVEDVYRDNLSLHRDLVQTALSLTDIWMNRISVAPSAANRSYT